MKFEDVDEPDDKKVVKTKGKKAKAAKVASRGREASRSQSKQADKPTDDEPKRASEVRACHLCRGCDQFHLGERVLKLHFCKNLREYRRQYTRMLCMFSAWVCQC